MLTHKFVIAIALMAGITFSQKAIPFLTLGSFKNSRIISYLAMWLPPAVMLILATYAVRMQCPVMAAQSLSPVIACLLTAITHIVFRNALLSISAGVLTSAIFNNFFN